MALNLCLDLALDRCDLDVDGCHVDLDGGDLDLGETLTQNQSLFGNQNFRFDTCRGPST